MCQSLYNYILNKKDKTPEEINYAIIWTPDKCPPEIDYLFLSQSKQLAGDYVLENKESNTSEEGDYRIYNWNRIHPHHIILILANFLLKEEDGQNKQVLEDLSELKTKVKQLQGKEEITTKNV